MPESADEDGGSSPPSKRAKRAKYVSKACDQCKKRKIKCDGDSPCRTCIAKGVECRSSGTDMRGRWRSLADRNESTRTGRDLASRLSRIEQRLSHMKTPEVRSPDVVQQDSHRDIPDPEERRAFGPGAMQVGVSEKVPTFSGETSITHNMSVVENRLEQMGVQYPRLRSASPSYPFRSCLTPSPEIRRGHRHESQTSLFRRVLDESGLVPDKEQWNELLQTFCDEVHILVPFLHLPSLWKLYEDVWETSLGENIDSGEKSGIKRVQLAHILLCLANGRCVESSRVEHEESRYSAGWSLYNAARDIFGDLLDGFRQCTDQIFVLQTYLLMVVYLFRLDAHGSAEKVIALSISHAHHIGLQRDRVVASMNPFQAELSRRLWWCLYLMDRRLAIETGRPFLIQDVNVDVGLPQNVSDEWLTRSQSVSDTASLGNMELPGPEITSVHYLVAMASYSRVVGKVWEALYGAATSESTPSPLLNEYLEHLITQSQRGIRNEFAYDPCNPSEKKAGHLSWWQVKQRSIMRIRWSSLYLLVRKPMLQKVWSPDQPAPEAIKNEVICMRLAQSIFSDFNSMPEQHPKHTFPFLHYITNATIIALGLIIRQPSFKSEYGELTLRAARSLWEHCRKTWVSGKMVRTVWKLNQMADVTINLSGDRFRDNMSSQNPNLEGFVTRQPLPLSTLITSGSGSISATVASVENQSDREALSRIDTSRGDCQPAHSMNGIASQRRPLSSAIPDPTYSAYRFEPHAHVQNATNNSAVDRGPDLNGSGRENVSFGSSRQMEAVAPDMVRPHGASSDTHKADNEPVELEDLDMSFTGEMINGGMEWLQSLFVNGLDAPLPPVWD
ncbi:uncharacterized protein N7483_000076 [Penicillium malachiteum]|uniref:uncharacterized protein n=1 Tax=Penicillium malachiteum TaxID=1324776 RepID=UPI0025481B23|nr:uncharacterized protein N7483_000076 [Penicillium malachiteum]KAJ5734951.1 hypothetical protein N7483_000076 [Penicillium malachiteum]